nr:protein BUD31 homolog 2 [Tanacetum cinerariifolium]
TLHDGMRALMIVTSLPLPTALESRCHIQFNRFQSVNYEAHTESSNPFALNLIAENAPHDGKSKCEALWLIYKITHQKSRYVFDL